MADIDIRVKATSEGLDVLDQASNKVSNLGDAAADLGDTGASGIDLMGVAIGSFLGGVATELIKKAPEIVVKLNDMGTASLRAKEGFHAMGGDIDTIQAMQDATKGLADDTDLLSAATELMSSKSVTSKDDLIEFAREAATLGITFQGDAKKGIDTFTTALESVGNVRSLRTLGIDTDAVKTKFEELKKTMDDKDAWRMAIFEEAGKNADKFAGNLQGAGTAIDRFKVSVGDFVEGVGEKFTSWIDEALSKLERFASGANVVTNDTEAMAALDSGTIAGDDSGPMGPPKSAVDGTYGPPKSAAPRPSYDHSRQDDVGFGATGQGGTAPPAPHRDAATIEKPKITAAEFDAIVRSANAATSATLGFGAAGAVAMGGLALSSAVAAGQISNIATQGNAAHTVLKQLEVDLKTLASLTINITATSQGGGSTGGARGGRVGGTQGPPR